MASDGSLKFDTKLDSSGFSTGLSKLGGIASKGMTSISGGLSKFGSFSNSVASGVGKAFVGTSVAAGTAIAAIGASAINAYGEYEQLVGGVDTLFGKSSKQVQAYADNACFTAGMSANEYMTTVTSFSASLLQSLGGDTAKTAEKADMAITDMADNANKMGSSMEDVQNAYQGFAKQNYTMLDNLKLGYGGTKSEMERLLEDAEKISGIEYDVSSYGDIVDAIHVVQTEMGITGTTAKEASTTIQGSLASMGAAWQNMLTGLTDESQDFDMLLENLIESIINFAGNLVPRLGTVLSGITKLITSLVPEILAILPDMINQIFETIKSNADTQSVAVIGSLFADILTTILSYAPDMIAGAVKVFSGFIQGVLDNKAALIEAVVNTFYALIEGLDSIMPQLGELAATIAPLIAEAVIVGLPKIWELGITILTGIVTGIAKNLGILMKSGQSALESLLNAIITNLPTLIDGAIQIVTAIVQFISDNIGLLVSAAVEIIMAITMGIIDNLPVLIDATIQLVESLMQAIIDNLPLIIEATLQIILAICQALIDNLPLLIDATVQLIDAMQGAFWDNMPLIIDAMGQIMMAILQVIIELTPVILKAFLDIAQNSADNIKSVDWLGLGKQILAWLWDGLVYIGESILGWIGDWISGIVDDIMDTEWFQTGSIIFTRLWNGIQSITDSIINTVKKLLNDIINKITSTDWFAKGKEILSRIKDGFTSLVSSLVGKAASLVTDIGSKITGGGWLAKGKEIVNNVKSGFANAIYGVLAKATELVNGVKSKFSINWSSIGSSIIEGIKNGLTNGINAVTSAAKNVATSAYNAAKSYLKINSPSKLFRDKIGSSISEGMAVGIEKNSNLPEDAVTDLSENILKDAETALSRETAGIQIGLGASGRVTSPAMSSLNNADAKQSLLADVYTTVELDGKKVGRSIVKGVDMLLGKNERLVARGV